jgi:hypothetical protein
MEHLSVARAFLPWLQKARGAQQSSFTNAQHEKIIEIEARVIRDLRKEIISNVNVLNDKWSQSNVRIDQNLHVLEDRLAQCEKAGDSRIRTELQGELEELEVALREEFIQVQVRCEKTAQRVDRLVKIGVEPFTELDHTLASPIVRQSMPRGIVPPMGMQSSETPLKDPIGAQAFQLQELQREVQALSQANRAMRSVATNMGTFDLSTLQTALADCKAIAAALSDQMRDLRNDHEVVLKQAEGLEEIRDEFTSRFEQLGEVAALCHANAAAIAALEQDQRKTKAGISNLQVLQSQFEGLPGRRERGKSVQERPERGESLQQSMEAARASSTSTAARGAARPGHAAMAAPSAVAQVSRPQRSQRRRQLPGGVNTHTLQPSKGLVVGMQLEPAESRPSDIGRANAPGAFIEAFDENGDGIVDYAELKAGLASIGSEARRVAASAGQHDLARQLSALRAERDALTRRGGARSPHSAARLQQVRAGTDLGRLQHDLADTYSYSQPTPPPPSAGTAADRLFDALDTDGDGVSDYCLQGGAAICLLGTVTVLFAQA